jgi:hypothetical protein
MVFNERLMCVNSGRIAPRVEAGPDKGPAIFFVIIDMVGGKVHIGKPKPGSLISAMSQHL